jgi:hypothetical protein
MMEITDGLSPEDVIVAAPGEQLTEGGAVRVANPQDATAQLLSPATAPVADVNK